MNKKLSIVIPTYNGGNWIQDTLESVLKQIESKNNVIELIVRDNASTDNTCIIIQKLNRMYNNIIIYDRRNETSIADVNFKEAAMLASGDYIVMLGDDDLIMPCYIEQTLKYLDEYPEIGLLYHNRISTTRDYNGVYGIKHDNPNKNFFHYYKGVEDFNIDYPTGPDFMSVNVVKRDCLIKGFSFAKECYYGVEWYAAMLYGLQGYPCISLFNPLILQRAPLVRIWDDKALLYVIVGMGNMFRDLKCVYPNIEKSWIQYKYKNISKLWYLTKCIPLNRGLYKEKISELSQHISPIELFVAKCLLYIPGSYYFFRVLYLLNKKLNLIIR